MRPAKKQIMTLILLLLTAFPLFLSVGLVIKQKIIQFHREERFESEFLQTITVSAEKIFWIKPGKEILANGKLFDVESFKISGSTITLTGFFDGKEEKLVKDIGDINQQKKDSKSPLNHLAIKFLFYPKYNHVNNFLIHNNWQIIAGHYPVYTEAISWLSHPITSPPPKYC